MRKTFSSPDAVPGPKKREFPMVLEHKGATVKIDRDDAPHDGARPFWASDRSSGCSRSSGLSAISTVVIVSEEFCFSPAAIRGLTSSTFTTRPI
jgi:hypothetical protein